MNPIVILGGAYLLTQMMGKGRRGDTDLVPEKPGGPTTSKPNISGNPTLTITDINDRPGQFLDNVKWEFSAGGISESGKHQSRKDEPILTSVGEYVVITKTDPNTRPGEKKPDVIMVVVKDRQDRTIIAKRIIVGDKQIIDIQ